MGSTALDIFHKKLDWPSPAEIATPSGAGAGVYARLAKRKLGQPLRLRRGGGGVRIGVLTKDPQAEDSEEPVGLLCEFSRTLSPEMLHEVQRLAWNFCRSPLLVTVERHLVRAWSCYETPNLDPTIEPNPIDQFDLRSSNDIDRLIDVLHWIEVASGQFVARHADRFQEANRADRTLLRNLAHIRESLALPIDITHDLLARVIFIQFLCQRKDKAGNPALNQRVFNSLYKRGVFRKQHQSLSEILLSKTDTYALFRWLNRKFNGDLFPAGLATEEASVKPMHLRALSNFVSGEVQMEDGQMSLWPLYAFDAIPLEFISSIYEEFVTKKSDGVKGIGDHYTPPHIVDFVLDRVLPWGGEEYNLRILDPACGSAVFLVKAFQRLVNRWRNCHPGKKPSAAFLRSILEKQLFGCDIEPRAIRVASFSLYLAMCDEIDPRHYWRQVKFPALREVTLKHADFFEETVPGIQTTDDARSYDLVIGNAPWGENTITPQAKVWANDHGWKNAIPDEQVGPLFLPKAYQLTKDEGVVCMIQPAGSLLFNISEPAKLLRKNIFQELHVEEIINLSALRFTLFPNAIGPSCIIVLSQVRNNDDLIPYWSPKPLYDAGMKDTIVLEEQDLNWIRPVEAIHEPFVWSAFAWGGRRDLELVQRLAGNYDTLEQLHKKGQWRVGYGFKRGVKLPKLPSIEKCVFYNVRGSHSHDRFIRVFRDALELSTKADQKVGVVCLKQHHTLIEKVPNELSSRIKEVGVIGEADNPKLPSCDIVLVFCPVSPSPETKDLRILKNNKVWTDCPSVTQVTHFDRNQDIFFEHPRDTSIYKLPLLLMKESWSVESFRFRNVIVTPTSDEKELLFSQSFYGIGAPDDEALASLALILSSSLAVHYFYMTSGRLASYRPTLLKTDLAQIPVPKKLNVNLSAFFSLNEAAIDKRAFELFALSKSEQALVEDFYAYTLENFKLGRDSAGRKPIKQNQRKERLATYCEWLIETLQAAFGGNKPISSTVYVPMADKSFPYYIVALRLASESPIEFGELSVEKARKLILSLSEKTATGNIFYRRILRVYIAETCQGEMIPTIYIVKPHEERYWTRSIAMRDADEITADLLQPSVFFRKVHDS